MVRNISIWCGVVLIVLATGCKSQEPATVEQQSQAPEAQAPQAPATVQAPVPAEPAAQAAVKKGMVAETMDAGGYTYMLVDDGTAQTWVAILQTNVAVGQEVSYYDGMVMENFFSKTLDRTFDKLVFSSGLSGEQPAGGNVSAPSATESFDQALSGEMQSMGGQATMPPGSRKAVVPFAEIKVDKATGENSYTVGELYEKAAELNGQKIAVRGKVVKVSRNIMGLNWIHVQDGTGSPDANTHDLVLTTKAVPDQNWDIITAQGVIAANKDFGAGYFYAVILEEAAITQ